MTITDRQVSDLVRRLCEERGITQNELGRKMGLASSVISYKMTAKSSWKFHELFPLAKALDVTPEFIIEELEKMVNESEQHGMA